MLTLHNFFVSLFFFSPECVQLNSSLGDCPHCLLGHCNAIILACTDPGSSLTSYHTEPPSERDNPSMHYTGAILFHFNGALAECLMPFPGLVPLNHYLTFLLA